MADEVSSISGHEETYRLQYCDMDSDQQETLLEQLRERRLAVLRVYEELQEAKQQVRNDKLKTKADKLSARMAKKLGDTEKAISDMESWIRDVKAMILEINA